MKKILLLLAVFLVIKASGQQPYYDFKKFKENKGRSVLIPMTKPASKDYLQRIMEKIVQGNKMNSVAKLIFTQPNGAKVYSLPQDNMMCLVPDMSQFNMPNPANGKKTTGMPPGTAPPFKILPDNNK